MPYAHALEALDIPVEVSGAGAFGDSREIEAFTTLLRLLADPQDPLPLIAVLRGPLFGISDPELLPGTSHHRGQSQQAECKSDNRQLLRLGHRDSLIID